MRTARDLSMLSLEYVREKKRDEWLALFAPDAVIQDPVGGSPNDPDGFGFRGREAIAHFWDTIISRHNAFESQILLSHLCGNEVANMVRMTIHMQDGRTREFDSIVIYRAENGLIASMRAFWEYPTSG